MKTNPNEPITPNSEWGNQLSFGLTKREYFSALALQGLCANPDYERMSDTLVSSRAVGEADRLIEKLNES